MDFTGKYEKLDATDLDKVFEAINNFRPLFYDLFYEILEFDLKEEEDAFLDTMINASDAMIKVLGAVNILKTLEKKRKLTDQ